MPDDPFVLALRDTVRCTLRVRAPRHPNSTRRTQRSALTACRSTNAWVSWMSLSRIRSRGSPTCPSTACWACSRHPQTCWRAGAMANRRSPPPCCSRWGACKLSGSRRRSTGKGTPRICPPALRLQQHSRRPPFLPVGCVPTAEGAVLAQPTTRTVGDTLSALRVCMLCVNVVCISGRRVCFVGYHRAIVQKPGW